MKHAHVYTDRYGRILRVSPAGAGILNLSSRGGLGRQLPLFFVRDRVLLIRQIDEAVRGHAVAIETVFRPLERAPRLAHVEIAQEHTEDDPYIALAWTIELQ